MIYNKKAAQIGGSKGKNNKMVFSKKNNLSFDDFSDLLQEVTMISYHRIYSDPDTQELLCLNDENIGGFVFEYVNASLFFMADSLLSLKCEENLQHKIMDITTYRFFRRIVKKHVVGEEFTQYLDIFHRRCALYDSFDRFDDAYMETIAKTIIELSGVGLDAGMFYLPQRMCVIELLFEDFYYYFNIFKNTTIQIKNNRPYFIVKEPIT